MADSNKPIIPGGDTVGTVGEVYLSKNGKTYECVAVIDNTTVTPNGETIPRVEYVWVCTDDGTGGGAFPFDVSDAEPITISRTKEELIAAIDAGKTPIGYWLHTQSNGTVIRLFHFVKRFNATDGINLTFYFSDKTSSGVLDIQADGTIKRTYQNNDGGGDDGCQTLIVSIQADIFGELTSSSTDTFGISFPDNVTTQEQAQAFVAKIDNALSAGKQIIIKDSSNNTYTPHWVERGKNNNYFLSFMVVNGATLFIFVLLKKAGNLYFSMNNLFKYSLTTISA